jgi:DNA-directed RNA polymerase subunit F
MAEKGVQDDGNNGDNGDNGGDNGGGDGGQATYTAAEVEQMVAGLKSKNSELLGRQKQMQSKLQKFGDIDPDRATAALEAMQKAEEEKQRAAGKFDELKSTLTEAHKRELAERDEKITKTTQRLYQIVGVNHAVQEISKVASRSVALLLPHVERVLRVVEDEDGDFVPRIVDTKGNERMGRNGDPMTVAEFLQELSAKDEFSTAFDAPNSSGSGAPKGGNRGSNATGDVRISEADARDVQKYRAAKAEAEKRGTKLIMI